MAIKKKRTIDRNSPIPLYKQIKEILIEELQDTDGEAGRPFSTEEELTRRFHVSRAPVRQALKELADEGYVYRERAKGTFPVQGGLPVRPLGLELGGLVSFLRDQGMDCQSEVLGAERIIATKELAKTMHLESDEKVLRISRLIKLKQEPFVWTQTLLDVPERFRPSIKELEETESVFELLERDEGIFIARGDHQISAAGATSEVAQILGIQEGAPVLVMETKLYTRNNELIGCRKAVHRAEDYKLSFTVNRNIIS